MLFILYVSELQDHLPSSIGSFQYADDTTIYSKKKEKENLRPFSGYRLRKYLVESLVMSKLDCCDTITTII